ncbi:BlaI/MecI/CopY family transcriptional regulator [Candidatus Woesearchaeota archaeon]|nr:BlaI/MecI/CopY family transcriptional regulator [Candidatus Woesearchaeota archaeon]
MKAHIANFNNILSPLEKDILDILWKRKSCRVREIHGVLKTKRAVALSSIAVLLDRLHHKNIVARTIETARGGMRYVYSPTHDQKGFEKSVVENAVNKLIERFGTVAVTYFEQRFNHGK